MSSMPFKVSLILLFISEIFTTMSTNDWTAFFQDAGITSSAANTYSAAFVQHSIGSDMIEHLDKSDLRDMGITAIGDIKRILIYAKKGNLSKYKIFVGESESSREIEGFLKASNAKIKQEVIDVDISHNEELRGRGEGTDKPVTPNVDVVFSQKKRTFTCDECSYSASEYHEINLHQNTIHIKDRKTKYHAHSPSVIRKLRLPRDERMWRDQCKFSCNFCSKVLSNRNTMGTHCKNRHGVNPSAKHYFLWKEVFHDCLICHKPVHHETKRLSDHMLKHHHVTLATYEETYYFPKQQVGRANDETIT